MDNTSNNIDIPDVFLEILEKRGVKEASDINNFLYPKLADLPHPTTMQGMEEAVGIVFDYIVTNRPIIIWGDYDVDGTTGTALLVNFFKEFGRQIDWHIPNRLEEGYGLNAVWFKKQHKFNKGQDFLVITVDCGTSDSNAVSRIKKMGGRVIITDHHVLPDTPLPDCLILNPSNMECGFHNEHLAGVGVAFYLAAGIRSKAILSEKTKDLAQKINLKQFLAFVALGTVADVVKLTSTNRILVRAGLEAIQNTKFQGVLALLNSCNIHDGKVSSEDIGFLLGPLINAAGRVGDSETVVKLLTCSAPLQASKIAKKLSRLNSERKGICAENLERTLSNISTSRVSDDRCVIVAGDIHQGVAGIVASRLVDMFGVPAIVLCKKTDDKAGIKLLCGSARSVEGVSIVKAIGSCTELLIKHGGHEMAAGMTLTEDNFPTFERKIKSIFKDLMAHRVIPKDRNNHFFCAVKDVMGDKHLEIMGLLEPFGPGNERPVFIDKNAVVVNSKRVGRQSEHLQIAIRGKYANYKGIGFGLGAQRDEIQANPTRNLSFTPTVNRFRGTTSWQIRILAI